MITVAGGASTQSRSRRPLPPGALSAISLTADSVGQREIIEFTYPGGRRFTRQLLTWVVGQSGILWNAGPSAPESMREYSRFEVPGSYGHAAEHKLADALWPAIGHLFTSDALSCRFFADGGTAMAAAARVCRHATGRWPIASYGYHGAAEEWAHGPATAGILPAAIDNHWRFEWGDVERLNYVAADCAAVCVEVPPVPDDEARAFLQAVRAACDRHGSIFILDEVVTGFRLALGGAAEYYGVRPDIACYGKAISAIGLVSAIVGRRELVDLLAEPVFYSTTFGGHPMTCAFATATVRFLYFMKNEIYGEAGHLRKIGRSLQDGLNALGLECVGQPERSVVKFPTDAAWQSWAGRMIDLGVVMHRPQFPVFAHTPSDVERTLEAAEMVGHE